MRDEDTRIFKTHFRRGWDKRWIAVRDTTELHPGDEFITTHNEVWEVGVRPINEDTSVIRKMQGVTVRRGVALLSKETVVFNRLSGEEAAEILRDFEAKVGNLFGSGGGDG